MELSKMASNLKMKKIYFSECSIERASVVKNGDYKADLQRTIKKQADHQYDVELKLTISKEDLSVVLVANGEFEYEADDYSEEAEVMKINTVAIMFPFIRSQVTLLTTQPGMTPIILPPINTTKFE